MICSLAQYFIASIPVCYKINGDIDITKSQQPFYKMSRLRLCKMKVLKYYVKNKELFEHENKVNLNYNTVKH